MTTSCDLVAQEMGTGIAAALTAVDCVASQVSEQAFNRLFGADGELSVVLTVLLTLYVGFFGISLMIGRSNLSIRSLIPKMMTIGLVLTFATSFAAFQTVFYNIVVGGPNQIANILIESDGSATATFAEKLDIVFIAIQQASAGAENISAFSPPGMMWLGAMLLLLGTVGLLVTAKIGLALLLAIGPIFVVMALFNGTRGLFVGWLKGLIMLALAPLFAILGGSIVLELAVPVLAALVAVPGQIDQQAAMAFFVIGFVHIALMAMALLVSAVIISKWQVFGFALPERDDPRGVDTGRSATSIASAMPERGNRSATQMSAGGTNRRIDIGVTGPPANDAGSNDGGRRVKVYATSSGGSQAGMAGQAPSRTRGIGNRFRSRSGTVAGTKTGPKTGAAARLERR